MVVLAMHVIGDCASHGDIASARRHRQKPALWQDQFDDFRQGDARFATQYAIARIKGDEAIEPACAQQGPIRIKATVAITTSVAAGQGLAIECRQACGAIVDRYQRLMCLGIASPGLPRCHQMALRANSPHSTTTIWLTRSVAANTIGSSCMSPRWAMIQTRLTQYSSTGQTNHSNLGLR